MQIRHSETFTTIRTEGTILPADLLQRIAEGKEIDGLTPSDYHLSGRLNEAINRSWNYLLATWTAFQTAISQLAEKELGTGVTRERWLLPLFQELGYGRLLVSKAVQIDGKSYPISHSWSHVPIHLVGFRLSIDKKVPGAVGAARMSPHGMVQEYINRSDGNLWGFVSNGLRLRILRDTASLTKQSYIEFDLEGMMNGEVYSDFVLLWLLCHESRLEADKPEDCWLEKWSKAAQDEGTRALDQLRSGVEKAIEALGRGFLSHPANSEIKDRLRTGELDKREYYRQILRIVYRLILLFVAEDRGVLLNPEANVSAIQRYSRYYSVTRLRRLAERKAGTRHSDLYQGLCLVMEKLGGEDACGELGLYPLGSFLFSKQAISGIDGCGISNRDLLEAIRSLTFITYDHSRRPVDYKHIGSEELGSVYESLLELHPELNIEAGTFSLQTAGGHDRKTTGSYYTPSCLVQCLLDSALDPVLDEAVKKDDPEEAILNLKVCDPASGSGHFLVAAAHRIAKRLASIRTGDDEPSPESVRKALRDVVGHCIYGVDLNPMAVELCKVSLWMEAIEPGKPLSFLDHHIKCGNSLLGTTPRLISEGIPDEAFVPIEGDDKAFAAALKKRNKQERPLKKGSLGQTTFHSVWKGIDQAELGRSLSELNAMSDDSIAALQQKEDKYHSITNSLEYQRSKLLADAWCAAFVWKKHKDAPPPITHDIFRRLCTRPETMPPATIDEIRSLSEHYSFFGWHISFPNVFERTDKGEQRINDQNGWGGGFDVILGNPPWDKIQPEEVKFFSSLRPDIANEKTASKRKKKIEELPNSDPTINQLWLSYRRDIEVTSHFIKNSDFLPYASKGNLNSYRLFAELASMLITPLGRSGMIVQSGMATDETGKDFFSKLLSEGRLIQFLDFENHLGIFPDVHYQFRFALMTIGGDGIQVQEPGRFGWMLSRVEEIYNPDRLIQLKMDDVKLFNPLSHTCPIIKTQRDLSISKTLYNLSTHIDASQGERFCEIRFLGEMFNMTRDSIIFIPPEDVSDLEVVSLYEAKCIHHYDHRFGSVMNGAFSECILDNKIDPFFKMAPRSFVRSDIFKERISKYGITRLWMLGFRDIASSTNERTSICAVFPLAAVGNNINLIFGLDLSQAICILSNCNSYIFDYACRQKVGGMHVNIWIMKQLPAIPFDRYVQCIWANSRLYEWIRDRALELTYTAWDLEAFAKDCGYTGPPFRWDEDRRFLLRCELDAAYFHLYGVEPDDVDYIMETFPIVKRKDEQQYGEYRTKRVIMEIYDAMAEAIKSGRPYQTRLDPPPADPRVAHPPMKGEEIGRYFRG
jgi:hypothetical protein